MLTISRLSLQTDAISLDDVNLHIAPGETFILLGPAASGKTALLETISGEYTAPAGRLAFRHAHPPVALISRESYLNLDGINSSLSSYRADERQELERYRLIVQALDLLPLLNRDPADLNGSEYLRLLFLQELGSAPKILLLDDPCSWAPRGQKSEIRFYLNRLKKATGTTMIISSRDIYDAIALGNRAAILNKGRIEQTGSIDELLNRPASPFVARYMGMSNLFTARIIRVNGETYAHAFTTTSIPIEDPAVPFAPERSVVVALRPEDVALAPECRSRDGIDCVEAVVTAIRDRGFYFEIECRVPEGTLTAALPSSRFMEARIKRGDRVALSWHPEAIHILEEN